MPYFLLLLMTTKRGPVSRETAVARGTAPSLGPGQAVGATEQHPGEGGGELAEGPRLGLEELLVEIVRVPHLRAEDELPKQVRGADQVADQFGEALLACGGGGEDGMSPADPDRFRVDLCAPGSSSIHDIRLHGGELSASFDTSSRVTLTSTYSTAEG